MPCIGVVGIGRVGSEVVKQLIRLDLADIVMIDINESRLRGEYLDLKHMAVEEGFSHELSFSTDCKDLKDSNVVVICAGFPRIYGMSRDELVAKNSQIVAGIATKVGEYAPHSCIIVVTNPVDVMTYVAWKASRFDRMRVVGFGLQLDAARMKCILSEKLGIPPSRIYVTLAGKHGDGIVVLKNFSYIDGKPLSKVVNKELLEEVVALVEKCGDEIAKLKGHTSSYGPAAGITKLVSSMIRGEGIYVSLSIVLCGEYGVNDVAIGVPVVVCGPRVQSIVELPMDEDERSKFLKAVERVEKLVDLAKKIASLP